MFLYNFMHVNDKVKILFYWGKKNTRNLLSNYQETIDLNPSPKYLHWRDFHNLTYSFAWNLPASQKTDIAIGIHQGRAYNLKIPEVVIWFNPPTLVSD